MTPADPFWEFLARAVGSAVGAALGACVLVSWFRRDPLRRLRRRERRLRRWRDE